MALSTPQGGLQLILGLMGLDLPLQASKQKDLLHLILIPLPQNS